MAKQVKLVINNRNEQVNYDSNGKESGSNTSASYNVVSETGEQIGSVNVSNSFKRVRECHFRGIFRSDGFP